MWAWPWREVTADPAGTLGFSTVSEGERPKRSYLWRKEGTDSCSWPVWVSSTVCLGLFSPKANFMGFRKLWGYSHTLTHTQSWEEDSIHTYTHILRGNWHHQLLMQINFLLQNRNGQPRIIRCRKKPKKRRKIPNQNLRKLKLVSSG